MSRLGVSLGPVSLSVVVAVALRGADKAEAVTVEIEASGDEVAGLISTLCGGFGDGPLLPIGLHQMAGGGETGEVFDEQTALASSAERELADELFVSGALVGGSLDVAEEFAVGHHPHGTAAKKRQLFPM